MNTTSRSHNKPVVGLENDVASMKSHPVAELLRLLVLDAVSSLGALNDPTASRSGTRTAMLTGELASTTRAIVRVLECHYGQPFEETHSYVRRLLRDVVGIAHAQEEGWENSREEYIRRVCAAL